MLNHFACWNKLVNLGVGCSLGGSGLFQKYEPEPRELMMSLRNAVLAEPTGRTESEPASLQDRLIDTRRLSTELARPLSDEDQVVQSMDDTSPTKWHLAHTTWFFEAFVLPHFLPDLSLIHI